MDLRQGIRHYQQGSVQSAGPAKIVAMLHEGAMKYLLRAKTAIKEQNLAERNRQINNAQAIISELRRTVDPSNGADLAERLDSLYDYVFRENLACQIDGRPGHIDNSMRVLQPLFEAWQRVPNGPTGPNPASDGDEGGSGDNSGSARPNLSLTV